MSADEDQKTETEHTKLVCDAVADAATVDE